MTITLIDRTNTDTQSDCDTASSHKQIRIEKLPAATVRIARQTEISPHSHTRVSVNSLATGMLLLEPVLRGLHFYMLYIAPGVIKTPEAEAFLVIVPKVVHRPKRLPEQMVLSRGTAPPPFFFNADVDRRVNDISQDDTGSND